jgi:hypothetical protein
LISDILGDKFKVRYALDNHGTPGLNSLETLLNPDPESGEITVQRT